MYNILYMGFFRTLGRGCLYFICSPLIIVGFVLWCAYSLVLYFCILIYSIIKFFKGERLTNFTAEDKLAVDKIAGAKAEAERLKQESNASVNNTNTNTTNTYYIYQGNGPLPFGATPIGNQPRPVEINTNDPDAIECNTPKPLIEEQKSIEHNPNSYSFNDVGDAKHE